MLIHLRRSRQACRQFCAEVLELPWVTGPTGAQRKLPGSYIGEDMAKKQGPRIRINGLLCNATKSARFAEAMVRKVDGLGGLREISALQRPHFQSFEHGLGLPIQQPDDTAKMLKEQQEDELLHGEQQAKEQQSGEVINSVTSVATVAREHTKAESSHKAGWSNAADAQKDSARELTKSERGSPADMEHPIGSVKDTRSNPSVLEYGDSREEDVRIQINFSHHDEIQAGLIPVADNPPGRVYKPFQNIPAGIDICDLNHRDDDEHPRIQIDIFEDVPFKPL